MEKKLPSNPLSFSYAGVTIMRGRGYFPKKNIDIGNSFRFFYADSTEMRPIGYLRVPEHCTADQLKAAIVAAKLLKPHITVIKIAPQRYMQFRVDEFLFFKNLLTDHDT